MLTPSAKLSFFLSNFYKPHLEQNDFQTVFEKNSYIRYRNNCFNPIVIHFPGSGSLERKQNQNRAWLNCFIDNADKSFPSIQKSANNIHVCQINNYMSDDKYTNPGEYFLNKANVPYSSSGKNIKPLEWKHSLKILLLQNFLEKIPVSNTPQYFLFFDSSDAILIGQPEILLDALKEYNCKILFGMDSFIYNTYSWIKNVINTPAYMRNYIEIQYRFINSGIIFGEVQTMKNILSFLINNYMINNEFPHSCDQHYYHYARFEFFDDIEIDYKRKYLLNIFHIKSFFEQYQ